MASWSEYIDQREHAGGEGRACAIAVCRAPTPGPRPNHPPAVMKDLKTGKLTSAAIVGQDGGLWAASPAFVGITADQVR